MQGFYVLPPILIGRFFTTVDIDATVDIDDGSLIVPTFGSFVYFVVKRIFVEQAGFAAHEYF